MAFVPYQEWTPEFERERDKTYMGLRTWLAKVFEVMCPFDKDWSNEQWEFGRAHRLAQHILEATSRTRHLWTARVSARCRRCRSGARPWGMVGIGS